MSIPLTVSIRLSQHVSSLLNNYLCHMIGSVGAEIERFEFDVFREEIDKASNRFSDSLNLVPRARAFSERD